jgi:hypothetical protein
VRERLKRGLASRRVQACAIALGVALLVPSLTTGLSADDWVHQLLVRPSRGIAGLSTRKLDLFSFADGKPEDAHALMDAGSFPWWTDPEIRLAFWRPISSLTHQLDHALWPRSAFLMHAQNLLWYALALLAVAAFYRRFLDGEPGGAWIAGLALLLYAVDDAHAPAVGWVANRNSFVALALSLPAVALHDRFRKRGGGAWLGPLVLAAGLVAGESALATGAYLFAHALCFERGRLAARFLPLWRFAVVVVAWRAAYHALGYGAAHSGIYLDPGGDTRAFAAALPARFAYLMTGQFALPWSDFASLYSYIGPHAERVMLAIAVGTCALVALLLTPVVRRSPAARFFAVGTVLAAVPICSTFPADRLLGFVGVGAMGLVALAIARARGLALVGAAAMILIHLILAPPFAWLRARSMATVEIPLAHANDSLPKTPDVAQKTFVLVNPPADLFAGYLQFTREARGSPPAPAASRSSAPTSAR